VIADCVSGGVSACLGISDVDVWVFGRSPG